MPKKAKTHRTTGIHVHNDNQGLTLEGLLAMEVPAPFVKGQKKPLGKCTVQEVKEAIRVLQVTGGLEVDIKLLERIADKSRGLGSTWTLEKERYDLLLKYRDYANEQVAKPDSTTAKTKK